MTGRVFHTSDWHLGRQIARRRRDTEFDAVIAEIIAIATDFAPDVIVHSGDLFDTWRPSPEDYCRAADALRALARIAPVVVVAGNHDTRKVLWFLEYILNSTGAPTGDQGRIRFATDSSAEGLLLAEYPTASGEQTVRIGALPYLHPNRFAYEFAEPTTATASYAQQMRAIQADVFRRLASGRGPRDILVFAAHLFVEGATPSYSEKHISLGSEYAVAAAGLPPVDYGALGHIHKPQRVPGAIFPAHYAGSPLQMDFGETRDTKSVVLAQLEPGKDPRIELAPLASGRRLVKVTGTLDEIAKRAAFVGDAWVRVVVDVDELTPSLSETLAEMMPRATIVDIEERRPGAVSKVLKRTAATGEMPSVEELLYDYLADGRVSGRKLDHAMATLADLQIEPDPGEPTPCCEEKLLQAAIDEHPLADADRAAVLTATNTAESEVAR